MPTSKKRRKSPQPSPVVRSVSRRGVLLGLAGLGAAVGAGAWAVSSFRVFRAEHDLSRLGRGAPSIVQVHDPSCATCTALQRQARKALRGMDDCGLEYLVADITTPDGSAFARRHGSSHVTLLLFDGAGREVTRLEGVRQAQELAAAFSRLKQA